MFSCVSGATGGALHGRQDQVGIASPRCARGSRRQTGGRRRRRLAFLLLVGAVGGIFPGPEHASGDAVAAAAPSGPDGDCHRVESERFVFHSDPWINLHHFLYQWAREVSPRPSGDRRRAVEVSERAQAGDLDGEERQKWERAVGFYRERLIASDLLFDRDLIALRGQLAAVSCSANGLEGIDAEIRAVLLEAMTVYRQRWWPEHHTANRAWMGTQQQELKSHEAVFAERLAQAYGGEWPPERIRVDVAAYSNWAGGYTTNHPDHVTISSTGYERLEGLEMLFHEVSHAGFFEQRILGQLAVAFRRRGADRPDRLSHAIQFATPAEILRSLLSAEERYGFVSVAERVARRSRWSDQYAIVLEYWKPFLDGQVERAQALDRIAEELAPRHDAEKKP